VAFIENANPSLRERHVDNGGPGKPVNRSTGAVLDLLK